MLQALVEYCVLEHDQLHILWVIYFIFIRSSSGNYCDIIIRGQSKNFFKVTSVIKLTTKGPKIFVAVLWHILSAII